MGASIETSPTQDDATGPRCPFCNAAWTEAMLDQYDALLAPNGCVCCGSGGIIDHGEDRHAHQERVISVSDLCCDACGKPIYRAHPASFR